MNDPRYSGRSAGSGTRTRSPQPRPRPEQTDRPPISPEERRRRRARAKKRAIQRRRFQIFVLMCLAVVILVSGSIGYFIGYRAGKRSAVPAETTPPADVQTADPAPEPGASEPPAQPQEPGDTTAPQILGVNKIAVFLGSTVSYRSGILVTDDSDPAPKLTIDSSQVNLSAPGTYPVYYNAADSAGNTTSVETTVTVSEAPASYVDEATIKAKADELLAQILTDGQTPEQQVNAIYDWIESHCYYIAEFDKSDYMQAAYLMLTTNRGDCYGFYAVSRLLFERMGLPNLTVTRLPNDVRTSNHWWNMVSLDNGESWYHFDSTPHLTYPTRTCLFTDAQLNEFNLLMPNYYYFDHESVPETPEA